MTHILYFSLNCQHCMKLVKLIEEYNEFQEQFQFVNVQTKTPIPSAIRSVPTILIRKPKERDTIAAGRAAFSFVEDEKRLYINAFEHGFGNNQYSYLETNGLCESNSNFTFLTNDGEGFQVERLATNCNSEEKQPKENHKSELELLVEKRNAEIPQLIERK